jgi:hypothetical protein
MGDEARGDEARGDETRGDEARGDETRGDEARGDEARGDEARGDEARGDETGFSTLHSTKIKPRMAPPPSNSIPFHSFHLSTVPIPLLTSSPYHSPHGPTHTVYPPSFRHGHLTSINADKNFLY